MLKVRRKSRTFGVHYIDLRPRFQKVIRVETIIRRGMLIVEETLTEAGALIQEGARIRELIMLIQRNLLNGRIKFRMRVMRNR